MPSSSARVSQLNATHPVYGLFKDSWDDIDLLNASGVRLANQAQRFLMKRPKELFDIYQERVKRFTYQSIMGQIIGWYVGALWRRKPNIEISGTKDPWYEDVFLNKCTPAKIKCTYNDLWQDIFRDLVLYKYTWLLTDLPKAVLPVESLKDEKDQHLDEPRLVRYDPRQVINWGVDVYGNITWAIIKTETTEQEFLGDLIKKTTWYYFDSTIYKTYEAKTSQKNTGTEQIAIYNASGQKLDGANEIAEQIDEGPHALSKIGRVPLQIVEIEDELWLANRVYLQLKDHINQENSLMWALFMGNLAMPVVIGQPNLTGVTMSEAGFLHLTEPNARFEWTEPKGTSFEESSRRLDRLREEIYRTVYLQAQGRSASAMASGASGYSKELDMMPANDVLNTFGDRIIAGMQDAFKNIASARGDDDEKVTMDVNGFHFETRPASESVSIYTALDASGVFNYSDTLQKTFLKRIAMDVVEDQNDDVKNVIKKEIDDSPSSMELEMMQMNLKDQGAEAQFQENFRKIYDRQASKDVVREETVIMEDTKE